LQIETPGSQEFTEDLTVCLACCSEDEFINTARRQRFNSNIPGISRLASKHPLRFRHKLEHIRHKSRYCCLGNPF
jgi:hypothetical protein